ncbi:UDP-glucose--hexose-1-phosphate uridylyltransferase [Ligilactobacillus sp. LYQ60]|uniref:UDP-glucose--hexose-1-phosphate uridylyltransferase n=1 Tax=unclassified Ligilactobacillus TaxID=2767920 RepID=UPI003853F523
MSAETLVDRFVTAVIAASDYTATDHIYLVNRVLNIVGEGHQQPAPDTDELIDLKDALVAVAVANGKVGDTQNERDAVGAELMNFITPAPSIVNRHFWDTYQHAPQEALADFFALSKRNDYIKTRAIAKNIAFTHPSEYGDIEITINLSKPEKDPKQIALAKKVKATGYPKCNLCMENEGYQGRVDHAARANHRIIRFKIDDHEWGFQYSPYAYFNEHCIYLDSVHEEMVINGTTFKNLLTIVQQFPGYFAGSNADLPIVGGSILSHEHYQGGRHTFAMEKAPLETRLVFADYEDVTAGIVKWPMSVIRLNGDDLDRVSALAAKILDAWRNYTDEAVGVRAETNGERHHTITPIARMRNGQYELDLVLRDNQTSPKYPDGIFHPHKEYQHIKKENIGLIEVMGLAILPPRLKDELAVVADYIQGKNVQVAAYHQQWADDIKARHTDVTAENAMAIVQDEVGAVFVKVLECAGVFKRDAVGQQAFMRFAQQVGLKE